MARAKPSPEIVEREAMMRPWIEAARREGYIAGLEKARAITLLVECRGDCRAEISDELDRARKETTVHALTEAQRHAR